MSESMPDPVPRPGRFQGVPPETAAFIRSEMSRGNRTIYIVEREVEARLHDFTGLEADVFTQKRVEFKVHRAAARLNPIQVMCWLVAVADDGRYVSGNYWLEFLPERKEDRDD